MDLMVDMLHVLNEFVFLINFGMYMSRICMSSCKWYGHINGTWWLESQAHLESIVASRTVESSVIVVLDIWEALIPCVCMCYRSIWAHQPQLIDQCFRAHEILIQLLHALKKSTIKMPSFPRSSMTEIIQKLSLRGSM